MRLKAVGAYAGVIIIYAAATLPNLLSFPPVWPDEVLFYSPAAALARGESMGTAVLAGFLPGIDHYTYWQPPGYFFFLSLILRLVPPAGHFIALRMFSWCLGAAVLLLGASILKRLVRNWFVALLGLVVLATEIGFMQVATLGRMETLSLACTMAALNCYLAYRDKCRLRLLALAGVFAGVASLCHLGGVLAGFIIALHEIVAPTPHGIPLKNGVTFAGCFSVPLLPWLVYIMRAPNLFLAQMLGQATRKSLAVASLLMPWGYLHWLRAPFWNAACAFGDRRLTVWPLHVGSPALVPLLLWCVGLAGLLVVGGRRVEASILGAWALAGYGLNLFSSEGWYSVYLLVPSCLLLGWTLAESSRRWMRAGALATLLAAGAWNLAVTRWIWQEAGGGWQAYQSYCLSLGRILPAHSTVLLAATPDPYFGLLRQSKAYRLYEFVPKGIPVDRAKTEELLGQVDYVVGSACCRPDYLVNYLRAHGSVEANLGPASDFSAPVVVWRLHAPANKQSGGTAPGPAP